ncbi:hypothetical protein [Virgisporangium aurantiacum]|uniref:Uncharacterized protein n=1 Tax=Virgisporangium aurantiacum TaxID=175570 RepID=A0A8J4E4J9_9ACTN|nr:hypothetical protein [Virgisporangium aurantiacum]GIJ61316.1 hypothetical protein Vau01_088320 [Virgisporangium aurantiacum]
MSDFDDEPRGRSATGAVIIAVIFLAILGTGVGIVLGSANKKDGDDRAGGNPSPTVTATDVPSASATGGGKPTNTKAPTGTRTYAATTRDKCPEQTQEATGTTMSVKRYIKTNRSEVWICSGGGKTVYQGHRLDKPFRAATSDDTLFIGSVRYEGGVYAATNGDTTYFVGAESLRREKNGVEEATEPVEDLYET